MVDRQRVTNEEIAVVAAEEADPETERHVLAVALYDPHVRQKLRLVGEDAGVARVFEPEDGFDERADRLRQAMQRAARLALPPPVTLAANERLCVGSLGGVRVQAQRKRRGGLTVTVRTDTWMGGTIVLGLDERRRLRVEIDAEGKGIASCSWAEDRPATLRLIRIEPPDQAPDSSR